MNLTELAVRVSCLEWENSEGDGARRVSPGGSTSFDVVGGGAGGGSPSSRRSVAAWATGSVPDAAGSVVAETLDSEELVDAAKAGDGPLVAALLARFASVNSIDGKARGPLHALGTPQGDGGRAPRARFWQLIKQVIKQVQNSTCAR